MIELVSHYPCRQWWGRAARLQGRVPLPVMHPSGPDRRNATGGGPVGTTLQLPTATVRSLTGRSQMVSQRVAAGR
jgi:hypothetical protein